MGLTTETTSCDLCGASDSALLFEGNDRRHDLPGRFAMVECRECGHVYLNPRPDACSIDTYYPTDYSPFTQPKGWLGRATRLLRRREARALERRIGSSARVLEVGCANGELLAALRDLGLSVEAVEPDPYAAQVARERHGINVAFQTVYDIPDHEGNFDAVIMRNVIEHVPSPRSDLRRVADLLRPGGALFITTDNLASLDRRVFGKHWYGYDVPRHLNLFSPESIRGLLGKQGFTVERIGFSLVPTHWCVSTRYLLESRGYSGAWLSFFSGGNPVLVAALLPLTFVQRLTRTGGRMTVLARKNAAGPH